MPTERAEPSTPSTTFSVSDPRSPLSNRSPLSERVLRFASAVAVTGDEILVGRFGAAARGTPPNGGVHIYRRSARSGQWTERLVLAPADVAPGDEFGAALAVDGRWLAVGAPRARHGRGAVYVFERMTQGHWAHRSTLTATAGMPNERFGAALALNGAALVVGAPAYAGRRGRAVIFRCGAGARWTEQAVLTRANTSHMGFGQALALIADEVLIGAAGPLMPHAAANGQVRPPDAPPQVLVFRDSGGQWLLESRLTSPDSTAAPDGPSALGAALVTNGVDLWVANPLASGSGAVFQSHRVAAGYWSSVGQLAPRVGGGFGAALAYDGTDLLIGAHAGDAAAIHVFRANTSASPNTREAAARVWAEMDRIAIGGPRDSMSHDRSGESLPRFEPKPQWFAGTLALAAAHGVVAIGVAWGDKLEGWGLALQRERMLPESHDSTAGARQRLDPRWHVGGTLTDTAWTTRVPLRGATALCRHGQVNVFRCDHVDLLAFLPIAALGSSGPADTASAGASTIELSGLWGWTDSATGREFALVGRTDGTSFVEVTDPTRPKVLGVLPIPDSATPSLWRDIKVYKNYAFIVSDAAGPYGLQIFDLTQLRSVTNAPAVFKTTARYAGIASAHTLILNPATGFAYSAGNASGGETCGGGIHMLDIKRPTEPKFVGCYQEPKTGRAGTGYIHDAQCLVYNGPDKGYKGKEICLNSAETALGIADVSDKAKPKTISIATYSDIGYVHQGWRTEDQRYFVVNDELDELSQISAGKDPAQVRTRTMVFDLRALADPVFITEFLGTTGATDHNLYIRGRYMYQLSVELYGRAAADRCRRSSSPHGSGLLRYGTGV